MRGEGYFEGTDDEVECWLLNRPRTEWAALRSALDGEGVGDEVLAAMAGVGLTHIVFDWQTWELLPRLLSERRFDEAPLALLARFATSLWRLAHFDSIDLDRFIADGTVANVAGLGLKIYDLYQPAANAAEGRQSQSSS